MGFSAPPSKGMSGFGGMSGSQISPSQPQMMPQQEMSTFGGGGFGGGVDPRAGSFFMNSNHPTPQTSPSQPQMTPQQALPNFRGGSFGGGVNPMMAQLLQRRGMG